MPRLAGTIPTRLARTIPRRRLAGPILAALALLAAACAGGCAAASPADVREALRRGTLDIAERPAPPIPARLAWYLPNRLADVLDLLALELHLGPAVGGKIVLTRVLAYGIVPAERAVSIGFHGREAGIYGADVAGESIIGWRHKADLDLARAPILGPIVPVRLGGPSGIDPDPVRDGWLDIESAGSVLLLGWEVKVRAGELPDLLAGLFGLDPSGDDEPRPLRVPLDGIPTDLRRASPELAALVATLPGGATATARPLWVDASGDVAVRLGIALETGAGKPWRLIEVVRVDGALAVLDERTRLARPWLR